MHVMRDMEQMDLDFELPSLQEKRWLKVIVTALPSHIASGEPGREIVILGWRMSCEGTQRSGPHLGVTSPGCQ